MIDFYIEYYSKIFYNSIVDFYMSKNNFNKINIRTKKNLTDAIEKFGFVPFFTNSIEGFSIEEHVSEDLWWNGADGWKVWEWKGPIIKEFKCAYGKFFDKKAVFVSKVYKRSPEKSYERVFNHLQDILPNVDEEDIKRLLK